MRDLFAAAACSCALVTDEQTLRFVAAAGVGAGPIVGTTMPVGQGIAGFAVVSGQPIAVADVSVDQRFARDVAEATDYLPTTILAAPLVLPGGDAVGVVEVLDPTSRGADTGRDLDVLGTLATLMATMVDRSGAALDDGALLQSARLAVLGEASSPRARLLGEIAAAANRLAGPGRD